MKLGPNPKKAKKRRSKTEKLTNFQNDFERQPGLKCRSRAPLHEFCHDDDSHFDAEDGAL